MKITEEVKQELESIYQRFFHDEKVQRMKTIAMHRGCNCFIHSFRVARRAIKNALRHKSVNLKNILIASILHDYYLYDWRVDRSRKKHHTANHPKIAIENASKDFEIGEEVRAIIDSHMWPMNFKIFPKTKEARITGLADTMVATREVLTSIAHKKKRLDNYYKEIEFLFDK